MLIKILEQNIYTQTIYQDLEDNNCEGKERLIIELTISITILIEPATSITISLKRKNQGSIILAHNLVFHTRTKHKNIQHHYICNEIAI